MELSQVRKHRKRKKSKVPQLVIENPLVLIGLDLPFVVVSASHLKNAVALSIEMFFIHFVTMLVAWFIASKLKVWQRVFVTATVSTVMMALSRALVVALIPNLQNHGGMYLYLIAVNSLTLLQANFLSAEASLKEVCRTSLWNILAFASIMLGVSVIREYASSGTLWGKTLPHFLKLRGVGEPFFGFILVGFMLSFLRYLNKKLSGFYVVETMRREQVRRPKRSKL